MGKEEFKHDHDLEKLQVITPRKRDFQMLVTPRYVGRYRGESYEDFTSDLLLNFCKDNTLFIDIGAHYGYYTLLAHKRYPKSKIIAFEPVPENFEILKRNVELNQISNAELYNLAVSNKDGLARFNVAEASSKSGFYESPLAKTCKEIEVRTVCLDSLFKETPHVPTVVKIDTEGHEPYVLQGMKRLLKECEDIRLIIEFNPKCLRKADYTPEQFLEEVFQFGFELYAIDDNSRMIYKMGPEHFQKWADYLPGGDENSSINILGIKKRRSLSVLFFSHSSQLAGAERSLLARVTNLTRDHGVVCSVILPSDGPLKTRFDEAGVSTLVINYNWWCGTDYLPPEEVRARLTSSFRNILGNLKQLNRINPDVIHTTTLVIPWGAVTASFLGKPHVWSIREFGEPGHGLQFYLPLETILQVIKESANIILVNSNAVKNALFGEASNKNIIIIYPYIDIALGTIHEGEGNYFTRTGATKLLIFGTITESKGQQDAILAVNELARRKRNVELIIMGQADPAYLERLNEITMGQHLEPYVKFIDFKENPYPVVNQADIVLVCSRHEAFGRVTSEAMLLKKPVIGTNSGGTLELIKEGFNGLLYEPGNYYQLADKIEYLIQHREKMEEWGENGYNFIKENFTKAKSVDKVAQLLRNLKGTAKPQGDALHVFTLDSLSDIGSEHHALQAKATQLQEIQAGIVMHFLNRYQRVIEKLLRQGTRRRYYYELGLTGIRVILNEGWRSFWSKFRVWRKSQQKAKIPHATAKASLDEALK